MKNHPVGDRSLPREFMALAVAPNLPPMLWKAWLRLRGHNLQPANDHLSALSASAKSRYGVAANARRAGILFEGGFRDRSRIYQSKILDRGDGGSGDLWKGLELLYGVRMRDVTLHRPFVEFCLTLPVQAFAHDGQTRWLARRLGEGLMPDDQRLQTRTGHQLTDLHLRLTPDGREDAR